VARGEPIRTSFRRVMARQRGEKGVTFFLVMESSKGTEPRRWWLGGVSVFGDSCRLEEQPMCRGQSAHRTGGDGGLCRHGTTSTGLVPTRDPRQAVAKQTSS